MFRAQQGRPSSPPSTASPSGLLLPRPRAEGRRPSTPADAKGLLKSAIRDPNPVLVLENEMLYGSHGPVPKGEWLVPIGKARIARVGVHVTIVSFARGMVYALEAAEQLAGDGIEAEVIDLRSLRPAGHPTIIECVKQDQPPRHRWRRRGLCARWAPSLCPGGDPGLRLPRRAAGQGVGRRRADALCGEPRAPGAAERRAGDRGREGRVLCQLMSERVRRDRGRDIAGAVQRHRIGDHDLLAVLHDGVWLSRRALPLSRARSVCAAVRGVHAAVDRTGFPRRLRRRDPVPIQNGLFAAWAKIPSPVVNLRELRNPLPVALSEMLPVSQQEIGVGIGWATAMLVYVALAYFTFLYRWPAARRERREMAESLSYEGQCHCGAIRGTLHATKPAAELQVRSCQCGFCTRHGAMTVSDPAGRAVFDIERAALTTYQFGTRTGTSLSAGAAACMRS